MKPFLLPVFILILLAGCNNDKKNDTDPDLPPVTVSTPWINYDIKASFPHDTTLFTEGFLMHDGKLFESTGAPNDLPQTRSLVGITDLATGKFEKKIEIDRKKYFGEGIVFIKGKLYELTYQNQLGFIYDANSFKPVSTFTFKNAEGWGLTTDGKNIIMSDGTENLTFIDPQSMKPVRTLLVTENKQPLKNINELELIKGYLYANVWQTNYIVKIDTSTGNVVGKMDLSSLVSEIRSRKSNVDVLNGIAYDSASNKVYVTGKLWPNIYQIEFPL